MRYWDSSAIVPLVVAEPTLLRLRLMFVEDQGLVTWWGSSIECASAIARRERLGTVSGIEAHAARNTLIDLQRAWIEVEPSAGLRDQAARLLRIHDLRAADALQLAAALAAAETAPRTLDFVCLDVRLAAAAEREGFVVLS